MKQLIKLIIFIFELIIFAIVKFIPKDKNLSIIGSSLGQHFNDNSKYLYLYLHYIQKDTNHKLFWITKNKDIYNLLNQNDLPVKYLYSISGVWISIRASKAFISHDIRDIFPAFLGGTFIVQLWHGIPLKKIGLGGDWDTNNSYGKLKYLFYNIFPFYYYMKCDELIAPCKYAKEQYKEAFQLIFKTAQDHEKIIILGQPRNDILLNDFKLPLELFSNITQLNQYKKDYDFIISWFPTHRKGQNKTIVDLMAQSQLDLEQLNIFCETYNILFVIKPHFIDINTINTKIEKFKNITVFNEIDPYPLLKYTDVLITDYSSIYFDFLLTGNPIIFAPFDYEEYHRTTSFYLPYDELTPGRKCYNWQDVFDEISNITQYKDDYIEHRNQLLNEFELQQNSSEVIYNKYFGEISESNK